jgi:hypothetical protein
MKRVISAIMVLSILAASMSACSRLFKRENEQQDSGTAVKSNSNETSERPTMTTTSLMESTTLTFTTEMTQATTMPTTSVRITARPPVLTTKRRTQTTTRKTTTTRRPSVSSKIEISPSSVRALAANTKVKRAWRVKSGSITVEVHKLAYGAPEWRTFSKKYTKSMYYQEICNIAIITCPANHFRSKCSEQLLGREEGLVYDMARSAGALVAVNCEGYTGHWDSSVKEKS